MHSVPFFITIHLPYCDKWEPLPHCQYLPYGNKTTAAPQRMPLFPIISPTLISPMVPQAYSRYKKIHTY